MQTTTLLLTLFLAFAPAAQAADSNPLGKVLQLIDELQAKIIKEGEAEAKAFKEFFEWCDDVSKNTDNEIKTATDQKAKLEAAIDKYSSDIEVCTSNIDKLAADIATQTSELNEATSVREKEQADFAASEKELMDAMDALSRAVGIISKEMAKNPASFAQVDTSNMNGLISAISAILDAAAFSSTDQKKLVAFVQAQQQSKEDDGDEELGAPASKTYKSHSGGILDVLEDMKDKAEGQLADLRKAETASQHNYDMLKQSLTDEITADTTDMDQEKSSKAAAEEGKATAEGDLTVTTKELAEAKEKLAHAHANCMTTASDHEATMTSRTEELTAIAKAEEILKETSGGAVDQTYSFLQSSATLKSKADLQRHEVVAIVKRLAKQHHSAALAQLASKINAVVRMGASSGANPFNKIKGLIEDMIAKLEKEMGEEADEKAYCDEEMTKTEAKKGELEADVEKMTSKIDKAAASSAALKEEVKELEAELATLAREQSDMDKIRSETNADYKVAKADLELGLSGVKKALTVLRDYYSSAASAALMQEGKFGAFMQQPAMPEKHTKSAGAGGSIIGILEVCESDFASNLAKEETEEADAQDEYEKTTQSNKVSKTMKDADVKYKTKEAAGLDKSIAEISGDRETTNAELSAVLEYYSKIKERCIAKPESYEERKTRRAAEIDGLKEALSILEDETAFVQRKKRGGLRGAIAL